MPYKLIARVALATSLVGVGANAALASSSICDAIVGNLVANCGFEGGSTAVGSSTVPNLWTPNAAYTSTGLNQVQPAPHSGAFALQIGNFDDQAVPSLSQTLTDVAGNTYTGTLFLEYGGNANGTPDTSAFFNVLIGSTIIASATGAAPSDGGWPGVYTALMFSFVGTGSDVLTIEGNTNPSEWFVDDISVPGGTTATPLPAALPLFATGIGGLGLLGWRRKRKARAN
jgi:hypothetical protein